MIVEQLVERRYKCVECSKYVKELWQWSMYCKGCYEKAEIDWKKFLQEKVLIL